MSRRRDVLAARDRSGDYVPPLREDPFQTRVIQAAQFYGWKAVHYRKSINRHGKWSTAIQGDAGGPDLLLAKNWRVLLVELKSDTGSRSAAQREWAEAIGEEVYRLWRPRDFDTLVVPELSGRVP